MKLSGTVLNARDYKPVEGAKITLTVQGKEIAKPATYSDGRYEYRTDEDYIGQTLTYVIEKDDFEKKTFSSVVDKTEINKKFLLMEHEILDRWTKLRWLFYGIVLFAAVIFLWFAANPEPTLECNIYDQSITNLELNSKYKYVCNISYPWYSFPALLKNKTGNWSLVAEDKWVYVTTKNGTGPKENIELWVYTPDSEYSPNPYENYSANVDLEYEKLFHSSKTSAKLDLPIYEPKKYWPKLSVDLGGIYPKNIREQEFNDYLNIENIENDENRNRSGTLYWTVRDNVSWVTLPLQGDKPGKDRGKVHTTDYEKAEVKKPTFGINFTNLDNELDNKTSVTGRITVESNNDGKMKIYIKVTKEGNRYIISKERIEDWSHWSFKQINESWYDYYDKKPVCDMFSDMLPPDFCPN